MADAYADPRLVLSQVVYLLAEVAERRCKLSVVECEPLLAQPLTDDAPAVEDSDRAGAHEKVGDPPSFDPQRSTRTFRIACSDAVATTLLQPILRLMRERSPAARLRLLTLDRALAEDGLARGDVDLLIGIPPVVPEGHDAELVYRDPMESIVRTRHPTVRSRLTLDAFAQLPHVDVALFGNVNDAIDKALAKHGRARVVQVALPHFSSVPLAVAETDCVATLSSRIARAAAARLPLRVLKPPVVLDPVEVRQVWHRRFSTDGGVIFLRALVRGHRRRWLPSTPPLASSRSADRKIEWIGKSNGVSAFTWTGLQPRAGSVVRDVRRGQEQHHDGERSFGILHEVNLSRRQPPTSDLRFLPGDQRHSSSCTSKCWCGRAGETTARARCRGGAGAQEPRRGIRAC
jgi:DNA-binding transcriptional LysR family regulator